MSYFWENRQKWLDDCLVEWNKKFNDNRQSDEIDFSESGDAYPKGIGGTEHAQNAVTPWRKSKHWVDWNA